MMQASEASENLGEDEEISKGHTEIIEVDGFLWSGDARLMIVELP